MMEHYTGQWKRRLGGFAVGFFLFLVFYGQVRTWMDANGHGCWIHEIETEVE